jgi:hypothetical protein
MPVDFVHAASVAGQGPGDIFLAILSALLFAGVGCGVIVYTALRHDTRR